MGPPCPPWIRPWFTNTNVTLSENTEFTHDNVPCGSITGGDGSLVGGGIIAFRMFNLTFNGNTTFIENSVGPHHSCGAN